MPSALLDASRVASVVPHPAADGPAPAADGGPRRLPPTVVAVAGLSVLQSLGLLTLGLTSLDGVFGTTVRPDGRLVALTLLLLAAWVVSCAGGGASLVDGAGRALTVAVACGEVVLLLAIALAGVLGHGGVWLVALGPLGALPVPALALLALGVPTAKLLLATSPSAVAWVQAGGRPRADRPVRAVEHRVLRGLTLGCIGVALTVVAVVGAPAEDTSAPSTAAVVVAP